MSGGGIYFVAVTPHGQEAIITKLNKAGKDTSLAIRRARLQTGTILRQIIEGQFYNAAIRNSEAFPLPYLVHLEAVLGTVSLTSSQTSPYTFQVGFNFGVLGTKEELEHGYHYGATLANGGTVDLPYGRAGLKNAVEIRYQFWRALRYHLTYKGRAIPDELWSDTVAARIAYWSSINKAPQWLLLQYGQIEWEPTNEPYPIVENTREAIAVIGDRYMRQQLFNVYTDLVRETKPGFVPLGGLGDSYFNKSEFSYHKEASLEPDLLKKSAKLANVLSIYINDVVNARNNEAVRAAIENLSSLSAVDFEVFLESMRRGE